MNKWLLIIGGLVIVLVGAIVIHRMAKTQTGLFSSSTSPISSISSTFDCLKDNCPDIVISGDPPATTPNGQPAGFHGYADPSIRQDPITKQLWLSYSYLKIVFENGQSAGPTVEIHLASSGDGGKTWQFAGPLWTASPDTNRGEDNGPGRDGNEVSNLLPVQNGNSVTWYGIRSTYFLPQDGNYKKRPWSSFRLMIAQASTPLGLASAPTATLGSKATASGWGIETSLSSLSPELNDCRVITEPALYYQNNQLYLVAHCINFSQAGMNEGASPIVVFGTTPSGDIKSWKWRYVGTLLKGSEASQLNIGAKGFTQSEIAKSQNGQLMLIVTPFKDSPLRTAGGGFDLVHFGCWAFEVKSIDPPSLATDSNGKLKVLANVTASDIQPNGPGSCGYDPASLTGLLIARRHLEDSPSTSSINITSIKF